MVAVLIYLKVYGTKFESVFKTKNGRLYSANYSK